jgi:hypothetical protein
MRGISFERAARSSAHGERIRDAPRCAARAATEITIPLNVCVCV